MDELWQRVRSGRHTAALGFPPGEPPASLGLGIVRVRCDVPPSTLGPLHDARRKVEQLLGSSTPLFDHARERMVSGLRRRLLGDVPAPATDGLLVETWNRLAEAGGRPAALVFEAIDAADDASLQTLRRILARPGWLRLPLVLGFRDPLPSGAAGALLDALLALEGPEGAIRAAAEVRPAAPAPEIFDYRALPPEVLRVLRAGALVGSGFEAELCAALLGVDQLEVLDLLQRAADAGVPIDDRGEGRFHLPVPLLDALRASVLPSLMIAWHRRLAALLGGFDEAPIQAAPAPAPVAPPDEAPEDGELARPSPGAWPYADLFAHAPDAGNDVAPAARPDPEPAAAPKVAVPSTAAEAPPLEPGRSPLASEPGGREPAPREASPRRITAQRTDEARAAGHLAAAGDIDAGAERYFAAAREAVAMGAHPQALLYGNKALTLLDGLPPSARRRRLRGQILVEFGRLQWQAAGPDPAFTLAGALSVLEAAREAVGADAPAEFEVEIATLIAGVCYDIGDPPALERALAELTAASRFLLGAGDAAGAARLLNDQAAVYVRMGDPVRATHLLTESRKIFEERAAADPVAMIEMAETDHLFARIPLHVAARPGREADALTMGLDHALAAERTYRRLDHKRDLGRVWETMGRLELRKGRLERARQRLTAAVELEESMGDLVGLARSTAALSELLAASGRHRDALALLGDSVALNVEKGSPIGLAFNRKALDALAPDVAASADDKAALADVSERLDAAESALGRMKLPGERD
jgi:tetratricopeptide (TPR) repeat protein